MAYKMILVHCADKRRVARIVGAAVELAERFQSHLTGLSIAPPVRVLPTGVPGTPDTLVIDERGQAYRRDNPEMKAAFEAAVQGRARTLHAKDEDTAGAIVGTAQSKSCDLIVMGSHGYRGVTRLLLGSVAMKVLSLSNMPVLICR